MAYQTRTRDPLLEAHMQQAITRRGKELLGLAIIALGAGSAAMLWSFSPSDPSWANATSGPVQNLLGSPGAAISAWLMFTIGWASWVIPVLFVTWGARFVMHLGDGRLWGRTVVIPVFAAAATVFLAAHGTPAGWPHEYGLGGVAGDAALLVLMDLVPLGLSLRLFAVTLGLGALFLGTGLFALGFTKFEVYMVSRTVLIAVILTYASILSVLGFTYRATAWTAGHAKTRMDARRAAQEENAMLDRLRAAPEPEPTGSAPKPKPARSRFSIPKPAFPVFGRGQLQPEDDAPVDLTADDESTEDRLRERINDAIKAKVLRARRITLPRDSEPPVTENIFRDLPDDAEPEAPELGGVSRDAAAALVPPQPQPQAPVSQPIVRPRKPAAKPSRKAQAEAQPSLFAGESTTYETPPLNLLANPASIVRHHLSDEALEENARMLESVLDDYGVRGDIVSVRPGPVVTMYELEPAPGLKASRVIGLADDIARSMSALSARVSTVPGRSVIGIELPNENRETVLLREILASRDYGDGEQALPLALGKDIGGASVVANLAKMPHLLIAGTTGSGKSVAINTMILSLLYRLSPDECRMIMIDPKMLELSVYDGIPHLLSPVVTDPKKAVVALKWVVGEMEERYRKMSKMGVRNIGGYNARV
ncbi:MAG: DNA translocase FtsK 4TM domain-containing protein, partial [Pseudomonadota bacterium]